MPRIFSLLFLIGCIFVLPQPLVAASENLTTEFNAQAAPANQEKLFVGLLVNDIEVNVLDVIALNDDYLLPIEQIFPYIDLRFVAKNTELHITSPTESVTIPVSDTYEIDNEIWITLSVLNDYLLLNANFDKSKFAISVFPPWRDTKTSDDGKKQELNIDFKPQKFSFRQIRLAHEIRTEGDAENSQFSELISSGAALSGSWRFEADKSTSSDWRANNYFWLKRNPKSQWLVGRQAISPSPISPSALITGVQYFSSNQAIPYDAYSDISQSSFFRQLGNSVQRISGVAEPGSIAELYVNGGLLSQIFVRLDGSYDFGEIQLPSGSFNEIEVQIKDVVSRTVIERQNKTSANSDYILDAGQSISSFAYGLKGNLLDSNFAEDGQAGMLLYRYGMTDRTSVEAGYLYDDIGTSSLGVATVLGKNFTSILRFANRENASASQIELNGYGSKWRLASFVRQQDQDFFAASVPAGTQDSAEFANANFYYSLSSQLRLELIGRHQDTGQDVDVSFVKPGFLYNYNQKLSLGARPEADGNYRSELVYHPNRQNRWRLTYQDTEQNLRYDWNRTDNTAYYFSYRQFEDLSALSTELSQDKVQALGFYWRPNNYDNYRHLRLELSNSERYGAGGFFEYRTPLFSGVYLDSQIRKGGQEANGGLSAYIKVAVDYAVANGKFIPGKNTVSYNTRGTIAGRLNLSPEQCDIDKASILVDGISYQSKIDSCSFHVDKILPGIHTVSLANEFLPIEFVSESKQYVVEVAPSAVTRIDFDLSLEYSAAGKVTTHSGKAQEGILVKVLDAQNNLITQAYSDQFGLFRVDSLKNGNYVIQAIAESAVLVERNFSIEDDFLFDLNLTIPAKKD